MKATALTPQWFTFLEEADLILAVLIVKLHCFYCWFSIMLVN